MSLRRGGGWLRLLAWWAVARAMTLPARELGGLIDERTRWLTWAFLGTFGVVGWIAGTWLREETVPGDRRRTRGMRTLVLGPAALLSLVAAVLWVAGDTDRAHVVLVGWVAWVGGWDVAFAAVPGTWGRPVGASVTDPEEGDAR